MKQTTLCFIIQGDRVLLAMKKRGFGQGKYNGVGGKVETNESIRKATIRETEEEIGVKIAEPDLDQKAILHFSFDGKPEWNQECHVFLTEIWTGEPVETEEMKPEWFSISKLPFENMWIDDPYWLPKVLSGATLEASFTFDTDGKAILNSNILEK